MKNILKAFVKYGILSNTVIALTLLIGIFSLVNTKKSFFPERESRFISIQVFYPGASPEEMEEGVTQRIEEAIRSTVGIEEINSTSSENAANISVKVYESYDIDEVYTDVKNAVDGISAFPVGAERPTIFKQKNKTQVMWVGLRGTNDYVTLNDLKIAIQRVEEDLLSSDVVSQVQVMGYPDREISIEIPEETLLRYGITMTQVADIVRRNNRDVSGGAIKTEGEEILLRSRGKRSEADRIGQIVLLANDDGSSIRVKDIATINEQFAETPNESLLNGQEAVYMRVDKLISEDLQEISDYVDEYIADFNKRNPSMHMEITFKFMDMLSQRLTMLLENGAIGLVLVLISLGLFLSLRLSLWVAWGIPSSFLGLFIFGSFVGLTINMISLFGMILVVGILVDDGIVIAENIYAHFEKGKSPYRAAVEGTLEVMPAVFTSVLTTIVAFIPLLLLEGGLSFLRDMGIVVIFALSFSLIEAFFVLPAHLASPVVLRAKDSTSWSGRIRTKINNFLDHVRLNLYGKALQFTLKYKWVSVVILLALFPITAGLLGGGLIKATFFPRIPFNSLNIDIAFKAGTRETVTKDYVHEFDSLVWQINEELKTEYNDTTNWINYTFSNVGSSKFGSGGHTGNVNVFFKELDDAPFRDTDLIEKIRDKIGEIPEADKFSVGNEGRWGKPVSIKLMSKNPAELDAAAEYLKNRLGEIPALKEIIDDKNIGKRELKIELKPQAHFLGLTRDAIVQQIRQGFFGEQVQRLQKGRDEIRVWVRYPKHGRSSLTQLDNMKIKVQGKEYPVRELIDYEIIRGISDIKHYMASRTTTVEAELVDPFAEVPPILEKINNDIMPEVFAQFPSVRKEEGGQAKESQKSGQEMMKLFIGAFLAIFIIIMLTFRSFYQAVLIISMIPLGWIGAAWGHGLHGVPISLLSAWGMIALSGVIINDAVVFLDKYNRNLTEGMLPKAAAFDAGISRFRPIMLTTMTTVAGLYPLIMETSFQAQFLIPMAIAVAWGVMVGTTIILLFFPVLILMFNDLRVYAKWAWTGFRPEPQEVERVIIDQDKDILFADKDETPLSQSNGQAYKQQISEKH
ncbi:efflux RND transporter permease subunit [Limibacter armeniacum]|uniref:efflux RND transporter permease subunit n=1 Tax=Limibacter armeniacum TaxID=466084 RepID=UPI002FE58FC1